jgi:hypothetical protein
LRVLLVMTYNPGHDFEIDLAYGQEGEKYVQALLREGRNVEVKRDRKTRSTENLAIDLDTLAITTSNWWSHIIETSDEQVAPASILWFPTAKIKRLAEEAIEEFGISKSKGGRRLVLIPIADPKWTRKLFL